MIGEGEIGHWFDLAGNDEPVTQHGITLIALLLADIRDQLKRIADAEEEARQ